MNINKNTTKSIYVEIYFNDKKIGTATGFEIQYGNIKYLITNWHVVSGKNFITKNCLDPNCAIPNKLKITYKKYLDNNTSKWVNEEINLYDEDDIPRWFEHPKYKNDIDVVAIPFDTDTAFKDYRECYSAETEYNLSVTENVYVIGFPLGYIVKSKTEPHAIWTSGTVASDPDLNLQISDREIPAFLIDSKTRQGQSGSPVIYYSEIGLDTHYNNGTAVWGSPFMQEIGIYSGRINKDSDLGYVWKWKVIKEILESISNKQN